MQWVRFCPKRSSIFSSPSALCWADQYWPASEPSSRCNRPVDTMQHISEQLKIWAVVAAVGGTIDPIRVIESNFLDGNLSPVFKQLLYILVSFIGAHMGTELIQWICRSRI